MRYAILSDIHANLPALQAVLRDVRAQDCGKVISLGDVIGYGNDHAECLQLVRDEAALCIRGNFEDYVFMEDLSGFNPGAAESIRSMQNAVSVDWRKWIDGLPYVAELDGFTLVHATLDGPKRWGYVFDKLAAAASFTCQNTAVCFFGHTHIPVAFQRDSSVRGGTFSVFKVERRMQYFVNVGSVGQPRDGNPKACYVIYDSSEPTIELRRVDYNRPGPDGDVLGSSLRPGPRPPLAARNAESA